ncbi:hypothetical protein GOEFS_035_00870 [Gordonia effusa NBRC 100432]|uniref:DUF1266 domain-containing protein n=1 Tax=Gordonia effusa NBRC 100432 TaxID=1077974 RepID=H0QXK4_9ACTN|nr:DUF1266 domain-containing protein [Gordonia effusa]GAB17555.1 hypothetical protein GOEFS_035_00870 [Gordonia effusa NBRC 100432]
MTTISVDPNGPLYDELAQSLALDAQSAAIGEVAWNAVAIPGISAYETRIILSRNGINSASDWVTNLGDTLKPDSLGDIAFVMEARAEMMRRDGHLVSTDHWLDELHRYLTETDQPIAAHDSVDRICPNIVEVDGWIADAGLLPSGTVLRSVTGMQIARAVTVVRWGAQSGYGDRSAVRQGLLAARDLAGKHFADWAEFGTSVLAGLILHTSPADQKSRWDAELPTLTTLLTASDSPWRNLDFPLTHDFTGLADW